MNELIKKEAEPLFKGKKKFKILMVITISLY